MGMSKAQQWITSEELARAFEKGRVNEGYSEETPPSVAWACGKSGGPQTPQADVAWRTAEGATQTWNKEKLERLSGSRC